MIFFGKSLGRKKLGTRFFVLIEIIINFAENMKDMKKIGKLKKIEKYKVGEIVIVSPDLTLLKNWIEAEIIKIRENPFIGTEIAVKDKEGQIFFGEENYFKPIKQEVCMQQPLI